MTRCRPNDPIDICRHNSAVSRVLNDRCGSVEQRALSRSTASSARATPRLIGRHTHDTSLRVCRRFNCVQSATTCQQINRAASRNEAVTRADCGVLDLRPIVRDADSMRTRRSAYRTGSADGQSSSGGPTGRLLRRASSVAFSPPFFRTLGGELVLRLVALAAEAGAAADRALGRRDSSVSSCSTTRLAAVADAVARSVLMMRV